MEGHQLFHVPEAIGRQDREIVLLQVEKPCLLRHLGDLLQPSIVTDDVLQVPAVAVAARGTRLHDGDEAGQEAEDTEEAA